METGCSLINDRLASTSPATPTKKAGALQEFQESPATVIDDPISAWDHTESFVGNVCTSSSSVKTAIIAELDELISKLDSMTPRPEQKTDAVLTSPSPIMDFPCSAWDTVDVDVNESFFESTPTLNLTTLTTLTESGDKVTIDDGTLDFNSNLSSISAFTLLAVEANKAAFVIQRAWKHESPRRRREKGWWYRKYVIDDREWKARMERHLPVNLRRFDSRGFPISKSNSKVPSKPSLPSGSSAPAKSTYGLELLYPDQNDDDDDEPFSASRMSSANFLLTAESMTPDVATSAEEKPEAVPAAEKPEAAPEPHSSTARDSFDAGKPEATTATSSSTFNYSSISNTPYYEERHERALTYGDDRVVLSGQQSYARLGEAHRVSSMFEYPPAHDTYYEEQSEHHEEDESNEQVLLHEYDSGSDYDDAISIGYYSDDN